MIGISLSKSCVAILILWAALGTCRQIACVRYDYQMRRFGISNGTPYYSEILLEENRKKQEAEDRKAQRHYQIIQAFLESQGYLGRTSVLKDFYSGRYK